MVLEEGNRGGGVVLKGGSNRGDGVVLEGRG